MKGKRAQAAMEFLMTYGWAILIILVAIAALAYFGVLNPTRYVADRCTLPVPMVCDDFVVNTSNVSIRFLNGDVKEISVLSVDLPGFGAGCNVNYRPAGINISAGDSAILNVTCSQESTADKKKSDLVVVYNVGVPPLMKTITGEIYSRVN